MNDALKIEPLYMEAYSNRAFCTIRRYQIGNSRVLTKNSNVTILASKDMADIPKNVLQSVCSDLNIAVSLGDQSRIVLQAVEEYWKVK